MILQDFAPILADHPNCRLTIMCSEHDRDLLKAAIACLPSVSPEQLNISYFNEGFLYAWAQDGSKPGINGQLLMPNSKINPRREEYSAANSAYAVSSGRRLVQLSGFFEGGDVVVGKRHVFWGSVGIDINAVDTKKHPEAVKAEFSRIFGKEVIEIGVPWVVGDGTIYFTQPDFHLDMLMAVVHDLQNDREAILLSSPRVLFREYLGINDIYAASDQDLQDAIRVRLRDDIGLYEGKLLGSLACTSLAHIRLYDTQMQMTKNLLNAQGYAVIEVPGHKGRQTSPFELPDSLMPELRLNYTNLVLSGGIAYLPEFGIPALDHFVSDKLRDLGYQTRGMPSAQALMSVLSAGPRCCGEFYRDGRGSSTL